jgi:hypothetical protein
MKEKELTVDEATPTLLRVKFEDSDNKSWSEIIAPARTFNTGSKGFHASGKIVNPSSGKVYQVSCSITLVGSKPKQ